MDSFGLCVNFIEIELPRYALVWLAFSLDIVPKSHLCCFVYSWWTFGLLPVFGCYERYALNVLYTFVNVNLRFCQQCHSELCTRCLWTWTFNLSRYCQFPRVAAPFYPPLVVSRGSVYSTSSPRLGIVFSPPFLAVVYHECAAVSHGCNLWFPDPWWGCRNCHVFTNFVMIISAAM